MLIRALCDYYDVLEERGKLVEEGFSEVAVQYAICLSPEGKITGINNIQIPTEIKDKKGRVKIVDKPLICKFPFFKNERSEKAYNIEHRARYIFGMSYSSDSNTLSVTEKAKNDKFKEKNLEFIEGMNDPTINAFRNFLINFVPEDEIKNAYILGLKKDVNKVNCCFVLDGYKYDYLQNIFLIQEKIRRGINSKIEEGQKYTCAISGKKGYISKLHYDIKGLAEQNGPLVCVKSSAGESYGKTAAFTSGISEESMEKYTKALNWLAQSSSNKAVFGEKNKMTVLFFSIKKESEIEDAFVKFLLSGSSDDSSDVILQINSLLSHIKKGDATEKNKVIINDKSDHYVIGLTSNGSRICMKFFFRDTFGHLFENVIRYQQDISMGTSNKPVAVWQITNELVRPVKKGVKENKENVPTSLIAALMTSILTGKRYPNSLYDTVLNRIKTDNDTKENGYIKLNPIRAGIIKAYLNRNYKEDYTMALDENRMETAYLCGRLFAVLENIQTEAQGELNTTIKDSYFATACTTPAVVFAQMILLAQNHLKKLEKVRAVKLENRMGWIINSIDDYPATFSNKEQGIFILGYYHQKYTGYGKKKHSDNDEE